MCLPSFFRWPSAPSSPPERKSPSEGHSLWKVICAIFSKIFCCCSSPRKSDKQFKATTINPDIPPIQAPAKPEAQPSNQVSAVKPEQKITNNAQPLQSPVKTSTAPVTHSPKQDPNSNTKLDQKTVVKRPTPQSPNNFNTKPIQTVVNNVLPIPPLVSVNTSPLVVSSPKNSPFDRLHSYLVNPPISPTTILTELERLAKQKLSLEEQVALTRFNENLKPILTKWETIESFIDLIDSTQIVPDTFMEMMKTLSDYSINVQSYAIIFEKLKERFNSLYEALKKSQRYNILKNEISFVTDLATSLYLYDLEEEAISLESRIEELKSFHSFSKIDLPTQEDLENDKQLVSSFIDSLMPLSSEFFFKDSRRNTKDFRRNSKIFFSRTFTTCNFAKNPSSY